MRISRRVSAGRSEKFVIVETLRVVGENERREVAGRTWGCAFRIA